MNIWTPSPQDLYHLGLFQYRLSIIGFVFAVVVVVAFVVGLKVEDWWIERKLQERHK